MALAFGSLSPVLGGEGWGEGAGRPGNKCYLRVAPPLTPDSSPRVQGEGSEQSGCRWICTTVNLGWYSDQCSEVVHDTGPFTRRTTASANSSTSASVCPAV